MNKMQTLNYGAEDPPVLKILPQKAAAQKDLHVISVRNSTYEAIKRVSHLTGIPQIELYDRAVSYYLSRAEIVE